MPPGDAVSDGDGRVAEPNAELAAAVAAETPLPQVVKQVRDSLCTLLAQADPQASEWVEEVRRARPARPGVVVVGETNRGKSSLVNALIGETGLSPVDAGVATATYLVFGHGPEWCATAGYSDGAEVALDFAEFARWASPADDPRDGHDLPPRYLRVTAPLEGLENLTLVDTPGVGGLDSMHGELAAEAAGEATALLFVVDASSPFTRGELDFLRRLGERVETVLFALTKTDHRGWREILAENRRLLAEHAPRFAEAAFYPVSVRLQEMAERAQDADSAHLLRARSGVSELRTALENLVSGRSAMLAEANTLRALSTSLAALSARLDAEKRALHAGEDQAATLRARRDDLTARRRSTPRGWQVKLRGEIQHARVETGHEVTRQVRELESWFRRAIDTADREELATLPHQVDAALQLISGRVTDTLGERLSRVADTALAELFTPEELDVLRAQFARSVRPPVTLQPPERRASTGEDKLLVFMGMSGGLGASRAAALPLAGLGVGALNPMILPATIALGLGAGWWMARTRRHAVDKQHLKQWLTEAIADARSTLDQMVAEQFIEAEQQLALALDDALGRRVEAIETELRDVDNALRLDTAERNRRLQVVEKHLGESTAGRDRAEQLLAKVRDLRDAHTS